MSKPIKIKAFSFRTVVQLSKGILTLIRTLQEFECEGSPFAEKINGLSVHSNNCKAARKFLSENDFDEQQQWTEGIRRNKITLRNGRHIITTPKRIHSTESERGSNVLRYRQDVDSCRRPRSPWLDDNVRPNVFIRQHAIITAQQPIIRLWCFHLILAEL